MINFLKYKWLYFLISTLVIGSGLFSIVKLGFKYSIDFVGGSNIEYKMDKKTNLTEIKKVFLRNKIEVRQIKQNEKDIVIRTKALDEKKERELRQLVEKELKTKITVQRFETVGPVLGKETLRKTIIASVLAVLGILIYITFAFKGFNYALAAILATIHDFLVVVGLYSLVSHFLGAEVDTLFITALLTTISFSVHDTIVICDKIREYFKKEGRGTIEYYANKALTETMVRSLNNSMTIIFMLLALILLGGATIKFFIIALLIGTVTGTYSSPFIATPILVWLESRRKS